MSKNMSIPWAVVRELVHKWSLDSSQLKLWGTVSAVKFSFLATSEGFTADELRFRVLPGFSDFSLKISALKECWEFDVDDESLLTVPSGFKATSGIRITMFLGGDPLKPGSEGEVIIMPLVIGII